MRPAPRVFQEPRWAGESWIPSPNWPILWGVVLVEWRGCRVPAVWSLLGVLSVQALSFSLSICQLLSCSCVEFGQMKLVVLTIVSDCSGMMCRHISVEHSVARITTRTPASQGQGFVCFARCWGLEWCLAHSAGRYLMLSCWLSTRCSLTPCHWASYGP